MTTRTHDDLPPPSRRIFCNRTLNLRSLGAIGFDMDYTLIQYKTEAWERRAYEHVRTRLVERGWPLDGVSFVPGFVRLGLVIDTELGNIVKANRFGYVKRACHGTRMMAFDEQRDAYARVLVDLHEPRWHFMNTQFSQSAACLYAQAVDLLDARRIDETLGYGDLYKIVTSTMDEAHLFGELKPEIMAAPDSFVDLDPELPLALLDLRAAGVKLLLITNSAWDYTQAMMSFAFDRFLPPPLGWRDLFHLVIVSARKPSFFGASAPVYEVLEDGLLRPYYGPLVQGGLYQGGHAALVEAALGLSGSEILYVGDHIFADVNVSKSLLRWRTALVVRELEEEIDALEAFRPSQLELSRLMEEKERLEHAHASLRLELQRAEAGYGPPSQRSPKALRDRMGTLRAELIALDDRIAPLAKAAAELVSEPWGLLMRAGNDKSHLARQIEQHADVYTSRVSNLLHATPFAYLRSPRGSLPHDSGPGGGV